MYGKASTDSNGLPVRAPDAGADFPLPRSRARVIALLALSDEGAPGYDTRHAAAFAAMGVPAFACTPDLFPELMAAALQRQDIARWAARRELVVAAPVRGGP